MSIHDSFDKLIIKFDTGAIPPPFCYRYTIKLIREEELLASLKMEYYDREEITEEEIFDEGFTLNDDFEWKGKLPHIWNKELQKQLQSSNWRTDLDAESRTPALEVRISNRDQSEILYPADNEAWEILSQEIIQAIFELAGKEAPLKIQFYSIELNTKSVDLQLAFKFALRTVQSRSITGNAAKISWNDGRKLLRYIYFFDYLPENGTPKKPTNVGNYINVGDGFWYDLKHFKGSKQKEKAEKLIDLLKSYTL
jgi:hypothetical protein